MMYITLVPVLNLLYFTFILVFFEVCVCVQCPIWLFSVAFSACFSGIFPNDFEMIPDAPVVILAFTFHNAFYFYCEIFMF